MPNAKELVSSELQSAVRLLIRGAAHELTELYNIPQPEADIQALNMAFCAIDKLADLPNLVFANTIISIRVSVEADYEDKLKAMEKAHGCHA